MPLFFPSLPLPVTLFLACSSWEARCSNKGLLVWVINQNWQGWVDRRGGGEGRGVWLVVKAGSGPDWELDWLGLLMLEVRDLATMRQKSSREREVREDGNLAPK